MRKLLLFLSWVLSAAPADAQFIGGLGTAGFVAPLVSASYVGPLDLAGLPAVVVAYSLRCTSTNYTGNVADIWDSATGNTTETLLTCSAGGTINETVNALATTCASGCKVKTLYDQSGQNKCSAAACNLAQATNSKRPTISTNCVNGHPCFQCSGATVVMSSSVGLTSTVTQPLAISFFAEQTGNFTANGTIFSNQLQDIQVGFGNLTNTAFIYAGTSAPTAAAANNAFHSIQASVNGASSELYVDGSAHAVSTGINSMTSAQILNLCAASSTNSNELTGAGTEVIMFSAALSTANKSALNSNQSTYW